MVIMVGPTQSSRYTIPDYSPIVRGMTQLGAGIGTAIRESRDRRRKEEREAEDKAALSQIFAMSGPEQAAAMAAKGGGFSVTRDQQRKALEIASSIRDPGRRNFAIAAVKLLEPKEAPETFETVDDPYGRGGVAQRSSRTGRFVGYQGPAKAAPPSAFRDKLAAMGLTEGSPEYAATARRLAMRPNTTIDARQMGTIPQDHRAAYDSQGRISHYEVIPGSPTARKIAAGQGKAGERAGAATERANIVNRHVGAVRKMVEDESFLSPVTGLGGSLMQNVPASAAHDMQQRLATLKALVGFKQLNEMRAQSPTGGALGNVTERELGFLQSVIGSLEQSQSRKQFLENLGLVENAFNRVVHGEGQPAAGPRQFMQGGGTEAVMQALGINLPGLNATPPPEVPTVGSPATAATLDPRYMGGVGTVSGQPPGAAAPPAPAPTPMGFDPAMATPGRFTGMTLDQLKAIPPAEIGKMGPAELDALEAAYMALARR